MGFLAACYSDTEYVEQRSNQSNARQDSRQPSADDDLKKNPQQPAPDAGPGNSFSMSWDMSTDSSIIAYKVFIVPPDQNFRFKGKYDVPIEVKMMPLSGLKTNNGKYEVSVTSSEISSVLGNVTLQSGEYCFSLVAVNNVGNSIHSGVVCP